MVVSCGAIESPRLLLNSKSQLFPHGLGNRHDWVGRNLQGHTYTGAFGLMPTDIYDDLGPGAGIAICDYNHGNPGLAGGAMLANEFIRLPYQFVGMVPAERAALGQSAQGFHAQLPIAALLRCKGRRRRCRCSTSRVEADPTVQGLLGDSGRAPFRRQASAHHRDQHRDGGQGGGVAQGSGRCSNLAEVIRSRIKRRAAPGGHLPHGR